MPDSLPENVSKLLSDLENGTPASRQAAANELGKLKTSDERVINALRIAAASDWVVRSEAEGALRTLGHEPPPPKSYVPQYQPSSEKFKHPFFLGFLVGVCWTLSPLVFLFLISILYMLVTHRTLPEAVQGGPVRGVLDGVFGITIMAIGYWFLTEIVKIVRSFLRRHGYPTPSITGQVCGGAVSFASFALIVRIMQILFAGTT